MTKTEFYNQYSHRFVKLHDDDVETGDYQLFHPEERYIAKEWLDKGYNVASVYEVGEGEDNVELDNDISNHPYKIGYIVLSHQ
jgi:hypothetical protein